MLKRIDMKLMKVILIAIVAYLLAIGLARAQEQVVIPLSQPGEAGYLRVDMVRGSINIRSYEGEEVVVRIQDGKQPVSSENTSRGLRKITGPSFGLEATEGFSDPLADVYIGAIC